MNLLQVDIAIPEVFVGGLLGSMLIFLFSAWACAAVGRSAQEVVNEVRRQFIERPGIMVRIVVCCLKLLVCHLPSPKWCLIHCLFVSGV